MPGDPIDGLGDRQAGFDRDVRAGVEGISPGNELAQGFARLGVIGHRTPVALFDDPVPVVGRARLEPDGGRVPLQEGEVLPAVTSPPPVAITLGPGSLRMFASAERSTWR